MLCVHRYEPSKVPLLPARQLSRKVLLADGAQREGTLHFTAEPAASASSFSSEARPRTASAGSLVQAAAGSLPQLDVELARSASQQYATSLLQPPRTTTRRVSE